MQTTLTIIAIVFIVAILYDYVKDVKPPEDFWQ